MRRRLHALLLLHCNRTLVMYSVLYPSTYTDQVHELPFLPFMANRSHSRENDIIGRFALETKAGGSSTLLQSPCPKVSLASRTSQSWGSVKVMKKNYPEPFSSSTTSGTHLLGICPRRQ